MSQDKTENRYGTLLKEIRMGMNLVDRDEFNATISAISHIAADTVKKTLGPYAHTTIIDDGNFVSADEINDLNEKFNQATGKAANESYVAMEANMRTVRISDIKNFFGNLLKNGRAKLSELGNLTNKVQQLLNRHKSNTNNTEDASGETKKQKQDYDGPNPMEGGEVEVG